MDHTQLTNLGESIGGVAVLVTLVYVAVQVRQGTAALASSRHHEMLDAVNRNSTAPISMDREFAQFVLRGQQSPDELEETDWYRFVNFAYGAYGMWEHAFVSHRRGLIDTEFWLAWDGAGRSLWAGPGFRKFWEQERSGHTPIFQVYIDAEVFGSQRLEV